jgi:hypothetical protein
MSILIVGSEGSMGKRYQAILKYLRRDFVCEDLCFSQVKPAQIPDHVSGFIIATPTGTHAQMIRKYLPFKKPILCEKPVVKNTDQLRELFKEIGSTPFTMMYQYQNLCREGDGPSSYDFFRHGNDGLVWDCLQIIGLSQCTPTLKEESPIWQCMLNGRDLDVKYMDWAYVKFVADWLRDPSQDKDQILDAHVKTDELARSGRYVSH